MSENEKMINDAELSEVSGGRRLDPTRYGSYFTYTLIEGDTLSSVALRFCTTVSVLADINSIADPDQVKPGQRLIIPQY